MAAIDGLLLSLGVDWEHLSVVVDYGDGHAVRQVELDPTRATVVGAALRDAFEHTQVWPLLMHDARTYEDICTPIDGVAAGEAALRESDAIDVAARRPDPWEFKEEELQAIAAEEEGVGFSLETSAVGELLGDISGVLPGIDMTGGMAPAGGVLLVPCSYPWESLTRIGYGGWNDCPSPAYQAAYLRYFYESVGAVPTTVGSDTVRFDVPRQPPDLATAVPLAKAVVNYCSELEAPDAIVAFTRILLAGPGSWSFW
jgi:uncharacterized protein DUF4253